MSLLFVVVVVLFFSVWHSVRTTVAHVTDRWLTKFVNKVGSTVLYKNVFGFSAFRDYISFVTKADFLGSFTIFYCRMTTIQPARESCPTSECWYMFCWHFCPCSSHKTVPFRSELGVTKHWAIDRCMVTALSIGIAQFFIIITRIGYRITL